MILIYQLDSDLLLGAFMLRQNHLAEAAYTKQTQLIVLSKQVLDTLTLPDFFQARKQGLVIVEEYLAMTILVLTIEDENLYRLLCFADLDVLCVALKRVQWVANHQVQATLSV